MWYWRSSRCCWSSSATPPSCRGVWNCISNSGKGRKSLQRGDQQPHFWSAERRAGEGCPDTLSTLLQLRINGVSSLYLSILRLHSSKHDCQRPSPSPATGWCYGHSIAAATPRASIAETPNSAWITSLRLTRRWRRSGFSAQKMASSPPETSSRGQASVVNGVPVTRSTTQAAQRACVAILANPSRDIRQSVASEASTVQYREVRG
jgi:hypothetical protein